MMTTTSFVAAESMYAESRTPRSRASPSLIRVKPGNFESGHVVPSPKLPAGVAYAIRNRDVLSDRESCSSHQTFTCRHERLVHQCSSAVALFMPGSVTFNS